MPKKGDKDGRSKVSKTSGSKSKKKKITKGGKKGVSTKADKPEKEIKDQKENGKKTEESSTATKKRFNFFKRNKNNDPKPKISKVGKDRAVKDKKKKNEDPGVVLKDMMEQEDEDERKMLEKETKKKVTMAKALADSDAKKSMDLFEEARQAQEDLNGPKSAGVALVCEEIGNAYCAREEQALAMENYERALNIFHILETGENFNTAEERQNMLELKGRIKQKMNALNGLITGTGEGDMVPAEITLDSSDHSRVRKPLSRQYYNLLSDHSTTASLSTATGGGSMFSDTWSLMTPQSQYPLIKKKIHPREEEKLGDRAEDGGDLSKAVEHYKTALSVLVRKRKPSSSSVLRVQIKIADTMFRDGQVFQAIKVYGSMAEHIEVKRRDNVFFLKVMVPPHSHDRKVINEFVKEVLATERKGDKAFKYGIESGSFMEAATFYNRALKALYKDKTLKPGNKHILRIHVKLGNIKWMMDEEGSIAKAYDKAVSYFERKADTLVEKKDNNNALYCYCQALRFLFKIVRPEDDKIIKIQLKLAGLFFQEGESLSALSLYRDAFNYMSYIDDPTLYHEVLTNTIKAHEEVGEGCIFENNAEAALFHYQEVLNFYNTASWSDENKKGNHIEKATIMEKIGDIHIMLKNYEAAEASYAEANTARTAGIEVAIGSPSDSKEAAAASAANLHKIGYTYEAVDKFDKALESYNQAIDLRKKWFGAADAELPKYQYSITHVQLKRGDAEGAFEGFQKVLELFDVTEPSHANVSIEHVNTIKELAQRYLQKGDKTKAFEFYAKQLDRLQRCKSTSMKDILEVLRNMANLLISIGNIAMALKYFELELQMKQKIKRGNEDDLAETHQAIGDCYAALGNHDKAYHHYKKGVYDDAAAKENLIVYNKIGIQAAKLKRYEEAVNFHQTCALYVHKEDDPEIVTMTYNNLANSYQGVSEFTKAEEYLRLVPEKPDGENSEAPSYILYNMGNLFQNKGLLDKAKECFDEFIELANKTAEEKESKVLMANALNNIGNILLDAGKYQESSEYYTNSLKIKTELFGKDSKEVLGTLCNIGSVMYRLRLTDKAYDYFRMALDITMKTDQGSMTHADVLHKLGNVLYMEKDYEGALEEYKKAFVIKVRILKDDSHPDVLLTRHNIGLLFLKFGKNKEALELFKDLYEKKKAKTSADDPEVAKILLDIAEAHVALEHLEEAKDLCIKAMDVFEEAKLTLRHPYYKRCRRILSLGIKKFLDAKMIGVLI